MKDSNEHQEEPFEDQLGGPGDGPDEGTDEGANGGEAGFEGVTAPQQMSTAFFHEVMQDLSDTNFARGWTDPAMYRDFLAWCESSEEADGIIAEYSPHIPSLLVDPDENVRFVSLHASVAAELMRALLDAYEQRRIEDFLAR